MYLISDIEVRHKFNKEKLYSDILITHILKSLCDIAAVITSADFSACKSKGHWTSIQSDQLIYFYLCTFYLD
jgi:hypothetical protein